MNRASLPSRPILRDPGDRWFLGGIFIVAFLVRAVPLLAGGGLQSLRGYDDGVYFAGAMALVQGSLPYRDFLLLHPPGILVALSPFALLGSVIGDPNAFAVARLVIMALGAANAVLVALLAGKYGRNAGLVAGALYAVWYAAANVERTTDLHGPQNTLLLLALLVLAQRARIGWRHAGLAGALLGLAMAVQLWQAASILVLLWWIVVRSRDRGRGLVRLRPAIAGAVGTGLAFAAVSLPFLAAAPGTMVREVVLDQVGRPNSGIGIVERLMALEGIGRRLGVLPRVVLEPGVMVVAVVGVAIIVAAAWRYRWTRLWAALALVQLAIILLTPSFFNDYPGFAVVAIALVIGTGLAAFADTIHRRWSGRRLAVAPWVAVVAVLVGLAGVTLIHREGQRIAVADMKRDVAPARCVTTDTPTLLILTSTMRRNLEAGCRLVLDSTGVSYDADRGRPRGSGWRRAAPEYQQAMTQYFTSGDAALLSRQASLGLSDATLAAIRARLPVERQRGRVQVLLKEGS